MIDLPGETVRWSSSTLLRLPTLCLIFKEAVDLGDCSVESDDLETVIRGVHDQVLAHDGQADEAEISAISHAFGFAGAVAGEANATVSIPFKDTWSKTDQRQWTRISSELQTSHCVFC